MLCAALVQCAATLEMLCRISITITTQKQVPGRHMAQYTHISVLVDSSQTTSLEGWAVNPTHTRHGALPSLWLPHLEGLSHDKYVGTRRVESLGVDKHSAHILPHLWR